MSTQHLKARALPLILSRLRHIFALSLVILAGIFVITVSFIPAAQRNSESKRSQLIEGENEWILQYDLVNDKQQNVEYTIFMDIDGAVYQDSTMLRAGKTYTYIHRIYPQQLTEGKVTFTLYEDGTPEPIELVTYNINKDARSS